MHRVYVPGHTTATGPVVLDGDEAHHLARVVRAAPGTEVIVFDGEGREWEARVANVTKASVTLDLRGERTPIPEPRVHVTLAVGILKGDQMDAVVRDATALGVSRIVPLASDHVAVPARAWRSGSSADRWHRIAVASAKQCGRAVVPAMGAPSTLAECVAAADRAAPCVFCVEPRHLDRPLSASMPRPSHATVFVGPEGGWSAAELALAHGQAWQLLSLGPRTLRAEIAPTVALTTLWTWWGW